MIYNMPTKHKIDSSYNEDNKRRKVYIDTLHDKKLGQFFTPRYIKIDNESILYDECVGSSGLYNESKLYDPYDGSPGFSTTHLNIITKMLRRTNNIYK